MVRTSCPAQQSSVFSHGSPQSPHKALWGHLVAQVAPLVYLRGSPLHSTTTFAKYFRCQCDSQEERHEVKFGGRKYREQVWSYKWLSLNPPILSDALDQKCLAAVFSCWSWTASQPHRGQGMEALGRCCQEFTHSHLVCGGWDQTQRFPCYHPGY